MTCRTPDVCDAVSSVTARGAVAWSGVALANSNERLFANRSWCGGPSTASAWGQYVFLPSHLQICICMVMSICFGPCFHPTKLASPHARHL